MVNILLFDALTLQVARDPVHVREKAFPLSSSRAIEAFVHRDREAKKGPWQVDHSRDADDYPPRHTSKAERRKYAATSSRGSKRRDKASRPRFRIKKRYYPITFLVT
jgi:hypothetical protein